jgi:hypothetical protein
MVPGHDAHERRVYLEDQFAIADQDGNGVVDFMEFVAFYTQALHDSRKSDLVHERRRKTQEQRARRRERALKYVQADALKTALAAGTLQLLSAQWLLARAGYASTVVERRGITKTKWSLRESPQPLPPFQVRGSSLMGSDDLVIASLIGRPSGCVRAADGLRLASDDL